MVLVQFEVLLPVGDVPLESPELVPAVGLLVQAVPGLGVDFIPLVGGLFDVVLYVVDLVHADGPLALGQGVLDPCAGEVWRCTDVGGLGLVCSETGSALRRRLGLRSAW